MPGHSFVRSYDCSVEGCSRVGYAKGLCRAHWARSRRTGELGSADTRPYGRVGCLVDGCERRHDSHGYCLQHAQALRQYGDPLIYFGPPSGDRNAKWVGEDCSYRTAHSRVKSRRGKASNYPCTHCGDTALDWAYDHGDPDERTDPHGPFSPNPEHYMPLCRACHKVFDGKVAA